MLVHLTDSLIYQNSWGTAELRALFDDVPRTRCWLEILAVLAETQAELVAFLLLGRVRWNCKGASW